MVANLKVITRTSFTDQFSFVKQQRKKTVSVYIINAIFIQTDLKVFFVGQVDFCSSGQFVIFNSLEYSSFLPS